MCRGIYRGYVMPITVNSEGSRKCVDGDGLTSQRDSANDGGDIWRSADKLM